MRHSTFAPLCIVLLAACESDTTLKPAIIQWMDWPAEVLVNTPFTVRLIVWQQGCGFGAFRPGVSADQSAVTFSPFFLVEKKNEICLPTVQRFDIAIGALDTTVTAPALAAAYARTWEMRGEASVYAPAASGTDLPVRTFGEVTVRLSGLDPTRRNAAGMVYTVVDTLGCKRVQPLGVFRTGGALVLENQTDTTGISNSFVRGYIYQPAAPVCGESTVFHLVSRN